MMPKRNFVAAQSLCMAVEVASPHSRAYVAGVLLDIVYRVKDIRLEDMDGYGH